MQPGNMRVEPKRGTPGLEPPQRNHSVRAEGAARAGALAWFIASLSLLLTLAGLGLAGASGGLGTAFHLILAPATTIAYAVAGALIAARQPANPMGWLLSVVGMLAALTAFSSIAEQACALAPAGLACADAVVWLGLWTWVPATLLPLTFVLLLFPDGRLLSPHWRPIAWSSGAGLVLVVLGNALLPRPPIKPDPPFNPYGVPLIAAALEPVWYFGWALLIFGVLGALVALVARFRRSRGIEREQVKWLAYGGGIGIALLALLSLWTAANREDPLAYQLNLGGVWVVLLLIVLAAGIAILRHRLYDIDLVINRTLVYGLISAVVVGLYVLIVGALGAVFQSSGNVVVALLATGLAALIFQPLRARLQRAVNRLMYGERDDPYTALAGLSRQLKSALAPSDVLPNMVEVIARTLKLPYVALALPRGDRLEIAAVYGKASHEAIPLRLVYQSETVGQLLVAPRAPGEGFSPIEQRLLDDIAVQAGIAAHAAQLTADLRRSREQLVAAREEERRRLRRDLHDGLGPQLASLTLSIAAARELLRHDPHAADRLLGELGNHAQDAIADIRRIVYGLRPPALDDLGLALALREQAGAYQHAGLQIVIDAPERLPQLPAAIEVAAYRIALEALTNVARHASARTCVVRLRIEDGLRIEVSDDGRGIAPGARSGVGLTSIRERATELGGTCEIESAAGQGTRIRVRLPLAEEIP